MVSQNFQNYWQEHNQDEEPPSTQLDILGESKQLPYKRERLDSATVYRRFSAAIAANGGDKLAIRDSVIAEAQELFDLPNMKALYDLVGGKRNDRSTLPEIAQLALMVSEGLSIQDLEQWIGGLPQEMQDEVNQAIVSIVRENAKTTRKWLPW